MKFNQRSLDFIGPVNIDKLLENNPSDILNPFAIISPHAGYIFSGDVAASIFNTIDPNKEYKNIFIISTSHTSNYIGAAILDENYETPYGDMTVNREITQILLSCHYDGNPSINVKPEYFHNDHTIEVILPFIQKRIKYKSIIPIMVGDNNIDTLFKISDELKQFLNDDNLFIVSSDFSHYPSYNNANMVDENTFKIIETKNEQIFLENIFKTEISILSTRMCGWSSYLILLHMMDKNSDIIKVRYKNSGDSIHGGKDSVVGYFGIAFCKK